MAYQGNLLSKTLVIGIIFLFIVMSIIPSVAVESININNSSGKSSGDDVDWWPMFRHDPQRSGYSTSKAPDTNNVLWSYKTGARIESSPAVADGKVYIGSGDDKVYCLDAINCYYIWSYNAGDSVLSSPAVVDDKVYFCNRRRRHFRVTCRYVAPNIVSSIGIQTIHITIKCTDVDLAIRNGRRRIHL